MSCFQNFLLGVLVCGIILLLSIEESPKIHISLPLKPKFLDPKIITTQKNYNEDVQLYTKVIEVQENLFFVATCYQSNELGLDLYGQVIDNEGIIRVQEFKIGQCASLSQTADQPPFDIIADRSGLVYISTINKEQGRDQMKAWVYDKKDLKLSHFNLNPKRYHEILYPKFHILDGNYVLLTYLAKGKDREDLRGALFLNGTYLKKINLAESYSFYVPGSTPVHAFPMGNYFITVFPT